MEMDTTDKGCLKAAADRNILSLMGAELQSNFIEDLIKYVGGSSGQVEGISSTSGHSLPDNVFSAGLSTHGPPGDDINHDAEIQVGRASYDSAAVLERLAKIPLHVRAQAEAWEIPRDQLQLTTKIGEGEGGVVFKCKWRGLDCAAKLLSHDSETSVAYHDMVSGTPAWRRDPRFIKADCDAQQTL